MGPFGIVTLTVLKDKIHVLGSALSCVSKTIDAPTSEEPDANINNVIMETPKLQPPTDVTENYRNVQVFREIAAAMKNEWPQHAIQAEKIRRILPNFTFKNGLFIYKDMVCITRKKVRNFLHMAHDCTICGQLPFSKPLSRMSVYF